MTLPTDRQARKEMPMARGLLDYFPDALAEVAHVSFVGNKQHNPGQPVHWAKEKSTDHADCLMRHLADRGKRDPGDGCRESAKVAWRALAMLQMEIEAEAAGLSVDDYVLKLQHDVPVWKKDFDVIGSQPDRRTPCGCSTTSGPQTGHRACYGGNGTHYCKDARDSILISKKENHHV